MNSIEKAFAKRQRKENNKLRNWWKKNRHIVWRILLFWLYIPVLCYDAWQDRQSKIQYDNNLTKKYLDKVLPSLAVCYCSNPNYILFGDFDGFEYGISFTDLYSSRVMHKYKRARRYFNKFYRQIEEYILNTYQIDGYKKINLNNEKDWKSVENIWNTLPWDYYQCEGVVFLKED